MNKKRNAVLSAIIGLSFLVAAPSSVYAVDVQPTAAYTQKDLNDQEVMGLLWVQTSAEYRELCYQAYNAAAMEVDRAIARHKTGDKPLAIVLDCDETVLDNSAAQGGYLDTDNAYSDKTWDTWVTQARAEAMPGAAEYLQGVAKKGVEIFYVTNRAAATEYEGTAKNLKKLHFPMVDTKHLLLKTDSGNKQIRFDQIAKNYDVAVYMGDNAGDLPIGTYHKSMEERNAIVDQHKAEFGTRFIVFPNPEYGDWEGSLAKNYWSLSPEQKSELRKSLIKKWHLDEK
jgi:5'-nucleotidase (lipoprotein e(P4) family)